MSRQADEKSTFSRFAIRILTLMVNPANATTGEAVDKLMTIPRNGIAKSASPNPTAERINAQMNKIATVI
jgi:hypothetical protein